MTTQTDILRIKLETDGTGKVRASLLGVDKEVESLGDQLAKTEARAFSLREVLTTLAGAAVVKSVVSTIVEFERLGASLKTVTGSTEAANAEFDRLKVFARETPYQLNQVVEAFIKLKALGLDPSQEALRSYGNTASAMGKSLNQFIEAVADAATGEFERLKEFGIKARQQADTVTFTFQGVSTTVGKSAGEIETYLRGIGENQFAGAMAEQMSTLGGAFSNLEDAGAQLAAAIGEAGLSDALKATAGLMTDLATAITTAVEPMDKAGQSGAKLGGFFKILSFIVFKLKQEFRDLGEILGGLGFIVSSIGDGFFDAVDQVFADRKAKRAQIEKETEAFVARLNGLIDKNSGALNSSTNATEKDTRSKQRSATQLKAWASAWADVESEVRKSYTPLETYTDEIIRLNGLFQAGLGVETYAARIAKAKEAYEKASGAADEAKQKQEALNDLWKQAEEIVANTATPLEKYNDEMTRLNYLLDIGYINHETWARAAHDAQQQFLNDSHDIAAEWQAMWVDAANNFARGIGNAVADAFVDAKNFSDAMEGLVKGVIKQLIASLVELAIKQVVIAAQGQAAAAAVTAASITEAAAVSSAWATPAALTSLASFGANAVPAQAAIASTVATTHGLALAGQAHDGLDNVPTTGTYLLKGGEMVLSEGNAKAMRQLLSGGGNAGGAVTINATINALDGREAERRMRPFFENVMQDIYNRRGKPGPKD